MDYTDCLCDWLIHRDTFVKPANHSGHCYGLLFPAQQKDWLGNALSAFLIGLAILLFVQYGIIQYTVKLAGYFDLYFVNTLHLKFGSGAITFFLLLLCTLVAGLVFSVRTKRPQLNLVFLCISFIYLGYGAFAYIPIRATANTNLNNSDPDNAFTLARYLNREQYIPSPLIYGPYFDAKPVGDKYGSIIYRKGTDRYEQAGQNFTTLYNHNTVLPRIFSMDDDDPQFYRR